MDLVERYLAAVGGQLSESQRADVVAELRDLLETKIEDRQAALGRPLTTVEVEGVLREVGHPLVVAAGYWRFNRLIGPEVFPFYVYTLKAVLLTIFIVQVILAVIGFAAAPEVFHMLQARVGGLWTSLVTGFAWTTVAFALLDRSRPMQRRLMARWRPKHLPPPVKRRKGRGSAGFEVGVGLVFILWWTGMIRFSDQAGEGLQVSMGAGWAPFFWPVLVYAVAQLAIDLIDMVRPDWVKASALGGLVVNLCGAGLALALTTIAPVAEVIGSDPVRVARLEHGIALGVDIALLGAVAVLIAEAFGDALRLARAGRAEARTARA